jgi:hypothetical protein
MDNIVAVWLRAYLSKWPPATEHDDIMAAGTSGTPHIKEAKLWITRPHFQAFLTTPPEGERLSAGEVRQKLYGAGFVNFEGKSQSPGNRCWWAIDIERVHEIICKPGE